MEKPRLHRYRYGVLTVLLAERKLFLTAHTFGSEFIRFPAFGEKLPDDTFFARIHGNVVHVPSEQFDVKVNVMSLHLVRVLTCPLWAILPEPLRFRCTKTLRSLFGCEAFAREKRYSHRMINDSKDLANFFLSFSLIAMMNINRKNYSCTLCELRKNESTTAIFVIKIITQLNRNAKQLLAWMWHAQKRKQQAFACCFSKKGYVKKQNIVDVCCVVRKKKPPSWLAVGMMLLFRISHCVSVISFSISGFLAGWIVAAEN